jgi:U3 small nucleolar ribonucleoprotein component
MNTISIDSGLYRDAEAFAKRHNLSVKQLVENYIHGLLRGATDDSARKKELELAHEDIEAGRVISYSSKEELFKDLGI